MLQRQQRRAPRRSVMISDKVRPHHLERKAILYVRQSSVHQVLHNRESSALQYAMRDRLMALGWSEIEVIDDDLGRSAAGGGQPAGSLTRRRAGGKTPCMMRRCPPLLLIQLRSAFSPRISKRSGMRRRRMLASRSALYAPSSMRLWPISTRRRPRSFSSPPGGVAPTGSCACPSAGADSATALLLILSKPCVNWC